MFQVVNLTSYKNPSLLEAVSADAARGLRLRREGRIAGGGGSLLLAVAVGDLVLEEALEDVPDERRRRRYAALRGRRLRRQVPSPPWGVIH